MVIWVQRVKRVPLHPIRRTIPDLLLQREPLDRRVQRVQRVQLGILETLVELDLPAHLEQPGQQDQLDQRVSQGIPGIRVGLDRLEQRAILEPLAQRVQPEPRVERV